MGDSVLEKQLETYKKKIKIMETALSASAGAYYNINLTQNVVPGIMYQVLDGVTYDVNEKIGFPPDACYEDVIEYWGNLLSEEQRKEFFSFTHREQLINRFENGEEQVRHRYWTKDRMGNPMLAEQHIMMYRDSVTGDILAVCYILNLTKEDEYRKRAAKQRQDLEIALVNAENANKAKTTFLNNMSHDIRTPMNAIIGFTSLAATHIDEPALLEDYLKKIMTSSNHLLSLINDVLDMSRIESGKVKIEEKPNNLSTIMHDLRNILQADVNSKRLKFLIDTVDVVDEDIICDKLRLNQILINCMSNAVKFTKPGGTVGIKIVQKGVASEGGYVPFDFIVSDTGIGMSKEYMEHVFEPFTREQTSTVSGIPGTGLGMAITKNIVDMMGGSISVRNEEGAGTEFTISLKFRRSNESHKIAVIKDLTGLRALVADDNMDTCVSVSRMLETIGMNPEWTMSGMEAVYKAKYAYEGGRPYKAFIIDWLMPDLNGVETVRRIRAEIGDDTPIIILTAYDWSEIEKEARAAGVTAFCAKPLFISDLYEVLSNAVNTENESERVSPEEIVSYKGKRILIVEDNDLNREITRVILEEYGLMIEEAENGLVGLEMVRTSQPDYYDMVFMDVQMPIMNGLDAARAIRKLNRTDVAALPIIAFSANAFDEDKVLSAEAGMNAHISKPLNKSKLDEVLGKYLK